MLYVRVHTRQQSVFKPLFGMYNAGVVKKLGLFAIMLGIIGILPTKGQDLTDLHWYFGNSASNLQFDKNGNQVYLEDNQATPFGIGGSAVVADQFTGDLLFYTDGVQVFDRTHTLVPNGASIISSTGGDFNQSAAACPIPGQSDLFYIFSNTSAEIVYAMIDKTQPGNAIGAEPPLGDVVSTETSTGLTDPSEGMILIPNSNNDRYWLISQNRTDFRFQVIEITSTAINGPVFYDFTDASNPGAEAVQMAYNIDSAFLAVAPRESNRNVQILDFNRESGVLAFNRLVLNTGQADDAGESIFDVEWSPNGSKLYMSRFGTSTGNNANILQFDLGDSLENINTVLANPVYRSLGIKRGPDDLLYHLYQGNNGDPIAMGSIAQADSIVDSLIYNLEVFAGTDYNATQFPLHAPSSEIVFDSLAFTYLDSCFQSFTKFFPAVSPQPTSYLWDFGDGSFSNAHSPVYSYAVEGFYNVTLTVELNGEFQSTSQLVEILPNQLMINVGNDTTICPGETLTIDAGTDAIAYLWSTGEITQTIQVDSAGTYWVEGIGANGCPSYDEMVVTVYGNAQAVSNQWYFGEMAGIDFTNGASAITDANLMESPEGCASISDVNGELLFYTNGVTVWNKQHQIMVNGTNIGGDSTSTQAALIVQSSNEPTVYYIFTTDEINGDDTYDMRYSVVDMKQDLANGAVVMKGVSLFTNSTERLTASAFAGNILLLGKEYGNNTFRSYSVDAQGISAPDYYPVGEVHSFSNEEFAHGYLKFNSTLDLVAVAIPGTPNYVEIFDYTLDSGMVNPRLININEPDPMRIYGVEFSTDGNWLYVTTNDGTNGNAIQFSLDSINAPTAVADIEASKNLFASDVGYGALQLGPDGQMYMARNGLTEVGIVNGQNSDMPSIGSFPLDGRTSYFGLPNFAQNISPPAQSPSMTITAGCTGQPTNFTAIGRDNSIETYSWDVGVAGLAPFTDQTFDYVYDSAGTYTVELTLSNRCDTDTVITQTVTIFAAPETPINPADTAFCGDPILLTAWAVDDPGLTYTWNTGETTREITVNQPGTFNVFITNADGCTTPVVATLVVDARPAVALGSDLTLCENETSPTLDAGNPGATYNWTLDGNTVGNTRFQTVDTSTPGTYTYAVSVVDPISFCTGSDTVIVTIQETPDVTVTPTQTTSCGANDAMIDFSINSAGNYSYVITGPVPTPATSVDAPTGNININSLEPGNYTLSVTNNVTSCSYIEVIQIDDPANWTIEANAAPDCGSDGDLELIINIPDSLTQPNPQVFVEVLDSNGQPVSDGSITYDGTTSITVGALFVTGTPYQILDLDTGTYFVSIADAFGSCTVTDTVVLTELFPQPDITFDIEQSVCSTGDAVFVTNNTGVTLDYTWSVISGAGTIVSQNANEVFVDGDASLQLVTSDPTGTTFCPRTDTIEVSFNEPPAGSIVPIGDPCTGEITLTVVLTNPCVGCTYTYNWNSNNAQTPSITVNQSNNYVVTVRDQSTGCQSNFSLDATVEDLLNVNILSEPDCEANGDLLLNANTTNTDVTFQWSDLNGELPGETNAQLRVTTSGTYTVVATAANGNCFISDSFSAVISPIDESTITLPGTDTFCPIDPTDPTTTLDAGSGFASYLWRLEPSDSIIGTTSTLVVDTEGSYTVDIIDGSACVRRNVIVIEDCVPRLEAPNAFSPNGDATNEEFFVFPNDYVNDFEIFIYSRWGELVYISNNQDFRWNGVFEGKLLPVGTYTYVIRFTSSLEPSLAEITQRGTVTLLR